MESLSQFLSMGGYGGFVWPAYGIALLVMLVLLIASLRESKAREAELDMLQRMRGDRQSRRGNPEASQP